ncbi:MAG TPA: alpha/beta hydrolase [Roseiflexaceae bacterium]|nr:alpha/beta hydrolase [Roseiflexaceae bacterium]
MAFVLIDGMRMYYAEHGTPEGPPLILLHGFTATGDFWASQLPAFGAQYRLIVPDLRSHGRTDNPGGGAAMNHRQFARDIIALCRALDIERAAFCGESTGAMLLLSLALSAPTLPAAMILAGGTHYFGAECVAIQRQMSPDTIDQDWRAYMQAAHTALGPDHWRSLITAFHDLHAHTREEDFPVADELRGIAAPVLIVHGDRDQFFPIEMPSELYRLLPNAELCVLPNTGHLPPNDRPDWFNDIALDFLTRHYLGST